jgi:hypothetical protein
MTTSVGMKARKKQSSLSQTPPILGDSPAFEQSLLGLESVCLRILESRFTKAKDDIDGMYWQQRFKNVATPISIALRECKGPRRFHHHYRHNKDDDSVLHPVMENPLATLAHVCEEALIACQSDLVGVYDDNFIRARRSLEHALQIFLLRYKKYQSKAEK